MNTFIDLFAGLGGFRLALEKAGLNCVFSSEINPHACDIYQKNFNDNPYNDISKITPENIPNFDVLCAGFPCQPFSIAGKKLGFEDTRGTLFFDICKIIELKKPKVLLLENVKNLLVHDNGNTFKTIIKALEFLNYNVSYKILNAIHFGLPQNRERLIIVGFNKELTNHTFNFNLIKLLKTPKLTQILNDSTKEYIDKNLYTLIDKKFIKQQKSGLIFCGYFNKNIRKNGVKENTLHLSRTHKQSNRIYHINGVNPTISSQESSGRYYIYDDVGVFKLSINDCFNLMGFPDNYVKIGNKTQLYNRIGNSVCIPMINSVINQILIQF